MSSPRTHQWVTSLRVTKSELIGTSHPPRNGIEAREVMETVTVIGSPQAAMAGVTLIDAVAGSSPPSLSSRVDPVSNGLVVLPVHRGLARAGCGSRVKDEPGVLELAERNDAEEHRHENKRHDEDGLEGCLSTLVAEPAPEGPAVHDVPMSCWTS